jgi:adenylate cyclase
VAEERVQRRLAAILAADVVGYTRLMGTDEAGTLARLKTLRSEIFDPKTAEFGGRIFKNTGDGALAEFGSSVDAVQCAVEIQRALALRNAELPEDQKLILRIGISQGDVTSNSPFVWKSSKSGQIVCYIDRSYPVLATS